MVEVEVIPAGAVTYAIPEAQVQVGHSSTCKVEVEVPTSSNYTYNYVPSVSIR